METCLTFTILIVKLQVKVMRILLVIVSIIHTHDVRVQQSLSHSLFRSMTKTFRHLHIRHLRLLQNL